MTLQNGPASRQHDCCIASQMVDGDMRLVFVQILELCTKTAENNYEKRLIK